MLTLCGTGCFVFAGLFILLFLVRPGGPSHWGFLQSVFVGALLMFGIPCVGLARAAPTVAQNVQVDDDGVVMEFAGRPTWQIHWSDPGLKLQFSLTPSLPSGDKVRPESITLFDDGHLSLITREVYEAVLESARRGGMNVAESLPELPSATRTLITHGKSESPQRTSAEK